MNINDLALGYDPTAQAFVTGGELASLITTATPSSDRGMILYTTDITGVPVVPPASSTAEFQRYIWIRVSPSTLTASAYIWNPGSVYILNYTNTSTNTPGSVTTNWIPLAITSIPPATISGSMIASSTIEPSNIDLGSLLTALGLTPSAYLSTASIPTAANIGGSFGAGLTINNKNVTAAMLLGGTIGQVLQTNDGTNDVSWVAPNTVGRILQIINYDTTSCVAGSVGSVLANSTSTPNYNATGMIACFNTSAFSKVDTTGNSKLLIEVFAKIGIKAAIGSNYCFIGLYNAAGATAPLAGTSLYLSESGTSTRLVDVYISYLTGINPTNATYYLAFGDTVASLSWFNSIDGFTNPFLITKSTIRITEYI